MSGPVPGTPLPWAVWQTTDKTGILGVGDASGGSVAHLWRDGEEREANAAYIAHACNNYPKAQALADALAHIAKQWPDSFAARKARAALAAWDAKP